MSVETIMADNNKGSGGIVLTPEQKKRQRERSIAIALALGVLVVMFFAMTMVRGPGLFVRPM